MGYIAPQLKQAKAIAWDILKAAAFPVRGLGVSAHEGELRVDYPNGAQVRLYGSDNPDAMRGVYFDEVVFDEPAQQPPDLWPEIIRPALADRNGRATFIGTPKGRDAFYGVARAAETSADWYSLRLPASRTNVIPQAELDAARAIMSASQYAREFECSFDEPDVAQFIDQAAIDAARQREGRRTGPKLIGVDVARHGDDRTVILCRDGTHIDPDDGIRILRGADLMKTAGEVAEIINRFRPQATLIDGVGVGGGVVDRLRQLQFANIVDVNAGARAGNEDRFANLRAEMWSKMRDWIKDRGALPDRDDLAGDLAAPLYEFDARNRLKLEKKEDMKSRGMPSPDIADALAMTFARTFPAAPELQVRTAAPIAVTDPLDGF